MTNEQLKQTAAAMLAHANGKPVQSAGITHPEAWADSSDPNWMCDANLYRPKPEPTVRPWSGPDDVPAPICWIRRQNDWHGLIVMVNAGRITACIGVSGKLRDLPYEMLGDFEYSTDRKTWQPCTITEP